MIEAHAAPPNPNLVVRTFAQPVALCRLAPKDGQMTDFFRWLAHIHAMRRKRSHRKTGNGRLYQGRYKSFLVQRNENLLTVLRYVERTAQTDGLVEKAQLWQYSSLWARLHGNQTIKSLLAPGRSSGHQTGRPESTPRSPRELERIQVSIERSRPFGTTTG